MISIIVIMLSSIPNPHDFKKTSFQTGGSHFPQPGRRRSHPNRNSRQTISYESLKPCNRKDGLYFRTISIDPRESSRTPRPLGQGLPFAQVDHGFLACPGVGVSLAPLPGRLAPLELSCLSRHRVPSMTGDTLRRRLAQAKLDFGAGISGGRAFRRATKNPHKY